MCGSALMFTQKGAELHTNFGGTGHPVESRRRAKHAQCDARAPTANNSMLANLLSVATAAPPPPTTTVYLMRHCARSTYFPDLYGGQEPEYLANYSDGGELPDWGVAPTLCTARGSRIVQGEGASLKKEVLARMGPQQELKVVYDAGSRRDNTTALDFLEGVGLPFVKRDGDAEIFTPTWAGCPELTSAAKEAAVSAQLAAVAKPRDYEARVAALQELLGEGAANFTTMPDVVAGGPVGLLGGSFVASSWIEAMLLQFGAGLPMGYGRVTPAMLYELLEHRHAFGLPRGVVKLLLLLSSRIVHLAGPHKLRRRHCHA